MKSVSCFNAAMPDGDMNRLYIRMPFLVRIGGTYLLTANALSCTSIFHDGVSADTMLPVPALTLSALVEPPTHVTLRLADGAVTSLAYDSSESWEPTRVEPSG